MSRILEQADEAAEVARLAFDAGDLATGIAAISLASQLVQLARLLPSSAPRERLGALDPATQADPSSPDGEHTNQRSGL
jgi:hypothetical protein